LVDENRLQGVRLQLLVLLALLGLFAGIIALVFQNRRADRQRQAELERSVAERTAQLSEANESLARTARLKDEFLAAMSHELRTPLNAILGFTELLLEGIQGDVNEKQAKSLRAVDESGRHLLSLINDVLDLSKIEAGQERLAIDSLAVEPVCQAAIRFVRPLATKKGLTLVTDIDPRVDTIAADERRVRQVLINLLSNAVKFTPDGGQVGLEVAPVTGEPLVRFTVSDTGIGISAENQAKLFQPFVQLDSKLSRQYSGTGLGLSLVSRLTEMHGGRVTLTSELGKGSRFSVFLPTVAAGATAAVPAPVAATEEKFSVLRSRRPTVLLVEDNALNRETIETYLTAQGCQVTVAHDGFVGLTEAARLRPAVVLMDVQMPGLDGLEATRRLKAAPETASLPVIALTALAMSGDREACLAAGANEYLTKPVNLKQLAALIERLVSARP
jgi:signal transduction histidine kinase/ActR/RegA family two-component response regulator